MAFVVSIPMTFVPGKDTFSALVQARDVWLPRYGWKSISHDAGPAGKILVAETRTVVFYLDGKPGATADTATKDVSDALSGVGLFARVSGKIVGALNEVPGTIAKGVGDAAGKGAAGFAGGAGIPGGVTSLFGGLGLVVVLAVGVGVVAAVVAVKRG